MKVTQQRRTGHYVFQSECKDDREFLDKFNNYIDKLEEENKILKDANKNQKEMINNVLIPQAERLKEEIERLRGEINDFYKGLAWRRVEKENKEMKKFLSNIKDLFNKWNMTGNDEFLEDLSELTNDN